MEMRYTSGVLFSVRKFLFLIFLFFFVGRHFPSLIKSRMTLGRHLVLIRATNAAGKLGAATAAIRMRI
jgi:hypothetical protein